MTWFAVDLLFLAARSALCDAMPGCLGIIQSCQQLDTCGTSYLNLVGSSKVATVMVPHWNEEVCEDLQVTKSNAYNTTVLIFLFRTLFV